jgi:hypothetical protein
MRARLVLAAGTAALALAGSVMAASPALAACGAAAGDICNGSTVATFTVTGGTLQISVPSGTNAAPDTLGGANAAAGALSTSGSLGTVTVTDNRAALVAAWAVSASSSAFNNISTGGSTTQEVVPASSVAYNATVAPGPVTSGTGTIAPLSVSSLAVSVPVATWAGVGVNSASWNPTIGFTLLPDQVAGTYRGTITHTLV